MILVHEREHSDRILAGTFDRAHPEHEEAIAIAAACREAPVAGCEEGE